MEQKVQVLVDNVADSACAVLNFVIASENEHDKTINSVGSRRRSTGNAQGLPSPTSTGGVTSAAGGSGAGPVSSPTSAARDAAGRALSKDVGQLRRLVQAAITALRNAEIEDQQRTTGVATVAATTATTAAGDSGGGGGG